MAWLEMLTPFVLMLIGVVLTGIGIWITQLIQKYISNGELNLIITSLNTIVARCVMEVYQTYVEELKDKNMFDKEAQKKALELCLDKIMNQIPNEIKTWLDKHIDDIREYLITLIESSIVTLKMHGK